MCQKFVETVNKTKEMEVEIEGSRCRPTDIFLYETRWDRAYPFNSHFVKTTESTMFVSQKSWREEFDKISESS